MSELLRLLIDVGNSRIKLAACDDGGLLQQASFSYIDETVPQTFVEALGGYTSSTIALVASVAPKKLTKSLVVTLSHKLHSEVILLQSESANFGVTNGYDDPKKLGVDRWLAMIAAFDRVQGPACIIDCGSAVTVDVIDADGRHLGGLVFPGLRRMQSIFDIGFEQVNAESVPKKALSSPLGRDTSSCVTKGCLASVIGGVELGIVQATKQLGHLPRCLITGGDAKLISDSLKESTEIVEDLVLEGIALYSKNM